MTNKETLLTPAEAAAYLRLTVETLRRYSANGTIPGRKIGWVWRYRRSDLEAFLSGSNTPKEGTNA